MDFGEKLKRLRRMQGLSQREFAARIGRTQGAIGFYERGEQLPTFKTIMSIADAFGVDPNYFLNDSADPTKTPYTSLVKSYGDFEDLVSAGDSPDMARRTERERLERFGDMIMRLNYEDRKKVVDFVNKLREEGDY